MSKPVRWTQELIDEYVKKGYWEETTLFDLWERNAKEIPDKEALVDSNFRLTWAEAEKWIDRLALGLLDLGLRRDDLIVVQLPTGVEHTLLRVACEKAGIVCLPALRNLRDAEMEYILGHTDAAGLVIPWKYRDFDYFQMIQGLRPNLPKLRHVFVVGDEVPEGTLSIMEMVKRPIEKEFPGDYLRGKGLKSTETSLIIHTTGTTGKPKFVEYAACHRLLTWRENARGLGITREDIFALITPHCGGIALPGFFGAPLLGCPLVFHQSPDMEDAFRLIERERVTVGCVVPTQLAMMADHPAREKYDLSSVRRWWCTGAPLPYEVGIRAEEKLPGIIVTLFGASDWGAESINVPEASQEIRFRTVGKPLVDGSLIKMVDDEGQEVGPGGVGEIWGSGPACVSGYYKDPEATMEVWTEDGWYKTGDLGKFDEAGNLMVVGRKKDMIIRGGMNVYPIEIENILLKHPKIKDVAIVGMPDPLMGQRACAFVVSRTKEPLAFEEMTSFLKEKKVSSYKLPERLELVDEIPTVTGKPDKKGLTAIITEKLRAEGKIN